MEASTLFAHIATDASGRIAGLREYVGRTGGVEGYEHIDRIARVSPLAVLREGANKALVMACCNGLTWLHVSGLRHGSELAAAKKAVAALPSTFAALAGADGMSLEVLVAIRPKAGRQPEDEADADMLCIEAHGVASRVYEALIGRGRMERGRVVMRSSMMWTHDPEPYVNMEAVPMVVEAGVNNVTADPAVGPESLWEGLDELGRNARMYAQAVRDCGRKIGMVSDGREWTDVLAELANRLRAMGMDEQGAFWQLRANSLHLPWYDEALLRDIVAGAYADEAVKGLPRYDDGEADCSRRFERFVNGSYRLRYNAMMLRAEYRSMDAPYTDWQPVDERVLNTMTRDARNAGLRVRSNDARTYVNSTKIREYNPVGDYLQRTEEKWDGRTDYIGMLARTVPCEAKEWERWFRKWFLYMVAQWMGRTRGYGNSLVPLLISEQGYNKSTFCSRLLPPQLHDFYIDNMQPSDRTQMMRAMHQFLLINLDEFNQIGPKVQEGFLKNLISLPSVKVKRPYGKHVEEFPRMASFIATTNMESVLSDPSGSRRFIGVRLTEPIDVSQPLNYDQLYAQAVCAVRRGEQYWLSHEEEQALMEHNRQFQVQPVVMELFHEYFDVVSANEDGEWLSATAILEHLRRRVGRGLEVRSAMVLGRHLTQSLPSDNKKRCRDCTLYLVRRKG